MTALTQLLRAQIAQSGPITLADYMSLCLLHPELGYYTTREPFGRDGDFTTAPEISQMFGELVGLSLASAWLAQGQPAQCVLAELGPGRGTLMSDALRATRQVPGFHDAVQIYLVEASPKLRALQAQSLAAYAPRWVETVDQLPQGPLLLVANEFFDALPIRQFRREETAWREVVVGAKGEGLGPGLSDPLVPEDLNHRLQDTKPGDIVETCAVAQSVSREVGRRVAAFGGAAIFVDYGDWRSLGDTFQAVRDHQPVDPFAAPGLADLTAHVDFEAIATSAAPARYSRLTPQGVFLERLGITPRAQALARGLGGAPLEAHIAAHRRLTHPQEMGSVFKALALFPDGQTPPAGFET